MQGGFPPEVISGWLDKPRHQCLGLPRMADRVLFSNSHKNSEGEPLGLRSQSASFSMRSSGILEGRNVPVNCFVPSTLNPAETSRARNDVLTHRRPKYGADSTPVRTPPMSQAFSIVYVVSSALGILFYLHNSPDGVNVLLGPRLAACRATFAK